jgi:LmbE family N-acetylglucosaminyl deacetylase
MATILGSSASAGASPAQTSSAELQMGLRKLGVLGSVLYVAAHPDDENTNLLAYLAGERLVRAGYLSLTRGDGGQNLIGTEQGTDLGVLRTQELLAARRIDGALQFFTRARDFGYSKSPEETLRIWGKDAVLADVVRVIRRFRPDVIITRFSPEPGDTHGHHTASAQLAIEAFRAAADPSFHPEQLGGEVEPWQARRIFWNRSSWNIRPGEDMSDFIHLDVDAYNPFLGASYGEIAADSRSMHKSQGFGVARTRGPIVEYFKLLAQADAPPARTSPFEGLDFSWSRLLGMATLKRAVARAERDFDASQPSRVIPALLAVDKLLDGVRDPFWRAVKHAELRDLVVAATGLFLEATAADFRALPGASLEVTATAQNRSPAPIVLREVRWRAGSAASDREIVEPGQALDTYQRKRTLALPSELPWTSPYWLAQPPEPGLFQVADPSLIGLPEAPPDLRAEFVFAMGGRTFTITRPIVYKWTDPVAGERYRAVEVTPRVSVRPETAVLVLPNGEPRNLVVRLAAGTPSKGTLRLEAPAGWTVVPPAAPFVLAQAGDESEIAFRIVPPAALALEMANASVRAVADVDGIHLGLGSKHIEHAHVPIEAVVTPAMVRLVVFPLARQATRIGYIPGPGDEVAGSLRQAGYDVTTIGDDLLAHLAPGSPTLSRFDAVVVGVRAFNTNEKLRAAHAGLLAYIEAGGTLVVQYNTNNRLAPLTAPLGPFPFEIGRERVTDEAAAVSFVHPEQSILQQPNRIGAMDFADWVQERGLYFASSWDPRYQTVLSMSDPGEPPQQGAILLGRHGKGVFIYTGLAFFRQLPAGVLGAFRLFANLIAAGQAQHGR